MKANEEWIAYRRISSLEDALKDKGLNRRQSAKLAHDIYYTYIEDRADAKDRLEVVFGYIERAEDEEMLLALEDILEQVFDLV